MSGGFVVPPRSTLPNVRTVAYAQNVRPRGWSTAGRARDPRCCRSLPPKPLLHGRYHTSARSGTRRIDESPICSARDAEGRDEVAVSAQSPADGSRKGSSRVPADSRRIAEETQRLLSVPTIDIKLELQMRGVDHRDSFEKVELARRLAEARAQGERMTGEWTGKDAGGSTQGTGSGPTVDTGRTKGGGENFKFENGEVGLPGTTCSTPSDGTAPQQAGDGGDMKGRSNELLYKRDVSRAMYLGKQATVRELNAMGIAHSRLADLSVLSQMYARAKAGERQEAEEARRFQSLRKWGAPSVSRESGDESTEVREQQPSQTRVWSSMSTAGLPWRGDKGPGPKNGREMDDDEEERASQWGRSEAIPETSISMHFNTSVQRSSRAERRRRKSLEARSDRMSSRELMKALDSLGTRYRIPAARAELKSAFVEAVLGRTSQSQVNHANANESRHDIVPVGPYDGDEHLAAERDEAEFGNFHSALSWARKLRFDDVVEELRYRGVQFNPKAGFSSLTRLLADEVLADEQFMGTEGSEELAAELERVMRMSVQDIVGRIRASGQVADVTSRKEDLAAQLAAMVVGGRDGLSCVDVRSKGVHVSVGGHHSRGAYRQPEQVLPGESGGDGSWDSTLLASDACEVLSSTGQEHELDDNDSPLELEDAVRSVGDAAWRALQDTGAALTETATALFPRASPATERAMPQEGKARRRRRSAIDEGSADSTGRSNVVRQHTNDARQAAANFAQGSANRAGLAVARTLANGILRGAEAAADWAGGGAVSREYVLLFIAAFCLVFKRGVGASVALLFLIRTGRVMVQKTLSRDTAAEHGRRTASSGMGSVSARAPSRVSGHPWDPSSTMSSANRRGTSDAGPTKRRSPRAQPSKVRKGKGQGRPTRFAGTGAGVVKRRKRRKPLWDESDDEFDEGCVVM